MYDVVIIGAGPAGATLARVIGNKYRVLLVDKRYGKSDDGHTAKCCGGLLAPDAQKLLARMGSALPREVIIGPQIFVVRSLDLKAGLERYYQRFYINIERSLFDRWLISLAEPIVETRLGRRFAGVESGGGYHRINLYNGDCIEQVEARILVGADGAASPVRNRLFPCNPRPLRYLAIQEHFHADKALPYFSAIFDPGITDFYCWTIPKEQSLILGAALEPGKDAPRKFALLKEKLTAYGYHFDTRLRKESALVLRPLRANHIFFGEENALLIGEAAGLISPSSAEGLSYAFASALSAAQALLDHFNCPAREYGRLAGPLKRNIFFKNLKGPAMYYPPLRRAIMRSGIMSMKVDPADGVR